jgi:membrane AbrB-like protein
MRSLSKAGAMTILKLLGLLALTVAAGTAGGALAAVLSLPAGWLVGSMIVCAALVIGGVPLFMPDWLRKIVFVLLGLSMGSAFTPETLATMFKWPASLVGLAVAVVGVVAGCVLYLHRVAAWSKPTAFFASVPGAMSYVLALALRSNADTRLVVVAQMLRLMVLMALLPIIVRATMPFELPPPAPASSPAFGLAAGLAIEIAAGFALGFLFEWLKVPAGLMLGGMIAGAIIHLSGTVSGMMPQEILIPCQVLLGAFIGLRFSGTDVRLLLGAAVPSLVSFVIAIAIAAGVAAVVAWGLDLPLGQVLVAFAPGGLEAMTIMAFVLGLDPAYVGVHQLARFLGISLILPFFARLYLK